MKIPPVYTITPEMVELIARIEAIRIYLVSLKLEGQVKEKIQRVSLLKSSLFSARIEGNTLDLSDVESGEKLEQKKKQEVFNIVKGAEFVNTKVKKGKITKNILLELHRIAMKDLTPDAGHFRQEVSAIFNQAGVAVYIPPPPSDIVHLLNNLLTYINSNKEKFPLVAAFVAHVVFEKIHPFLDGNGRAGRLLIAAILKAKDWDFTFTPHQIGAGFTVPFEKYLDEYKDEYYYHLDLGLRNTNDFLLFMLKAFLEEIEKIKMEIEDHLEKKEQLFLPPRQEEIFNIIKDHAICSFDMVRRRFLKVPERTLRYDLKKLLDKKLIEKSGETRARYYRVKGK